MRYIVFAFDAKYSFSIRPLMFIHRDSFLMSQLCYICYTFFDHLSIDGHFGCFHVLALISNSGMNMGVQISFQDGDFVSFR